MPTVTLARGRLAAILVAAMLVGVLLGYGALIAIALIRAATGHQVIRYYPSPSPTVTVSATIIASPVAYPTSGEGEAGGGSNTGTGTGAGPEPPPASPPAPAPSVPPPVTPPPPVLVGGCVIEVIPGVISLPCLSIGLG